MDSQSIFINEILTRIDAYFSIYIRAIRDQVPKAIGHFLVRASIENMHIGLYKHINQNQAILEQLSEPTHIAAERKGVKTQLDTFRQAQKLIKRDPNIAAQNQAIERGILRDQEVAAKGKASTPAPVKQEVKPPPPKSVDKTLFGGATPKDSSGKKSLF